MLKTLLLIGPLFLTASGLSASSLAAACVAGTLANYEALPATGCNVGALNFSGFGFSPSGTVIIGAGDIMVTPATNGVDDGLDFTSIGFKASGTNTSTYVITYLEDPTGPIRSLDDVLDDPVTAPGRAEVDTMGCLGAAFTTGGICPLPFSTVSISVFDDGIAPQLSASVSFAGLSAVGVQDKILLEANGTGSASITGFGVGSDLSPEPGSGWLCAAAVLALFLARKPLLKLL